MAANPAELESALRKMGQTVPFNMPSKLMMDLWRTEENYYSDISVLTTALSPITLFTVTGLVEVLVVGVGTASTSTGATGTLAVGFTALTTLLLGTTTVDATNFPASQTTVWIDTSPTVVAEARVASNLVGVMTTANIILTIATNNMLTGTMRFCCKWRPWSADGSVISAR